MSSPGDPITVKARHWAQIVRGLEVTTEALHELEELHSAEPVGSYGEGRCTECGTLWPCDTRKVIDEALT